MKYLAIIATRDSSELWGIAQGDFSELCNDKQDKKLLIWQKDDELSFADYKDKIESKISSTIDFELGVIFHKLNGDADSNVLREILRTFSNEKLAFCEWYSSNKTDFWNETIVDANLPYNNLKKAWKDNNGDKEKTFETAWDYFMVELAIENPLKKSATSLPFDYVYANNADLRDAKHQLLKAVEQKLKK